MLNEHEKLREFTEEKLTQLRQSLANPDLIASNVLLVTFGSFARREASEHSDLDYLILSENVGSVSDELIQAINTNVRNVVGKLPSATGAFGKPRTPAEILTNIGGSRDTNDFITHRLLFLLEGEWLSDESKFNSIRKEIIEKYVEQTPRDHQLALFLLNDIIRYWRTVTVDYVYKTAEADEPKPWGSRNIKLVFSRKLLYASGLFSVAMTADRTKENKVEILEKLFRMPVIDRMIEICGENSFASCLKSYNFFLEKMSDAEVRGSLDKIAREDRENDTFRQLKNEGHNFTRELMKVFEKTFHSTHPIYRSVIF
ncbi:MAG: hypothetical protein GVY13_02465 [Alphaproteobacteria bacterium]|jgi:predicted nucleotidyltransferase|nr:hypothetical protein [Alphaproteobacteria bacterium]